VHLDVDEVVPLQLATVGRERQHVACCSPQGEEPEQAGEASRTGVEFDCQDVAVVRAHLEAVNVIRDDPQPRDDVRV
jgi:hypothetical protein